MSTAAFFDMDRTVLRINSGTSWVKFLHRRGELSRLGLFRALGWALQYKLAVLDMETLSRKLAADLAGDRETDMLEKCRVFFDAEVARSILEPARRCINQHRALGDRLVLLTSATPYVAEPLAQALRLDAVLCTRLEVVGGQFTGKVVEPICYGAGKVKCAESWAAAEGIDLSLSAFYSDSYSDLPMLERVGTPVAVNPDPRLGLHARQKGWSIRNWDGET